MSVRIKVSYTDEAELAGVIRQLSPILKSWKKPRQRGGRYKNAYAVLEPQTKPGGTREKQPDTEQRAKPGETTGNGEEGRHRVRESPERKARPPEEGKALAQDI